MSREAQFLSELRCVIASVRFYLEQERSLGVEYLDAPPQHAAGTEASVLFDRHRTAADPRCHMSMRDLRAEAQGCERCPLHQSRTHVVFGVGNEKADLVFVGEAPGAEEDRQGEPFVGKAGQLLTNIIRAIKLERADVYILNVLKCRPPNNRDPEPFEIEQCTPFLERQIELIRPKVICTLGKFASQTLLGSTDGISRLRGRFHRYRGIPVMPTYHPAFLLRNPTAKRDVWEDVQKVQALLHKS